MALSIQQPRRSQCEAVMDSIEPASLADIELAICPPSSQPSQGNDRFLVAFDEHFDTENPKDWSYSKKRTVTDVLSATSFNRIMVSTIMAPALNTIAKDLHMNRVEATMALSIYLLATAFGPLIIGPLSEVYGRKPILHVSNVWFLAWNIVCGFATSKGILIAARLLAGLGASAAYALAGGVLGDIWRPEQRGKSLGIYLLFPVLGAAVGPIIGGLMTGRATWRWMFWATSAFQAVMIVASYIFFHESYAPLILYRRAEKLRQETGDRRYQTAAERLDGKRTALGVLGRSLSRPLRLLIFHPTVQFMACLSAFNYGILYIILSSFSNLWTSVYHESVEISGLHYLACALGEVAGTQVGGPLIDKVFKALRDRARGEMQAEFHVPLMLPGALIGAIGLFIYGWAAHARVFWLVVDIGVFINMFGSQVAGVAIQAYIIDSYPEHTSSVFAASQFLRSLTAFAFPLFVSKMYSVLGYGWGNTTLALMTIALGIPAPLMLWFYGSKLRAKSTSTY